MNTSLETDIVLIALPLRFFVECLVHSLALVVKLEVLVKGRKSRRRASYYYRKKDKNGGREFKI